jgi:integrase/recombinase XerD
MNMDLKKHLVTYLESLEMRNYAASTVKRTARTMEDFFKWNQDRRGSEWEILGLDDLEAYQTWLWKGYKTQHSTSLSVNVQITKMAVIARFFKWCHRNNLLTANPANNLMLPKKTKAVREFLTIGELNKLFSKPDLNTPDGIRDRTMMEVFYSTGMRESELAGLQIYDVDSLKGTVWIRLGKHKKDRVVPIGARALNWIDRYLKESRFKLVQNMDEGYLFLSCKGRPFNYQGRISGIIRGYKEKAGIIKYGACHLLRHSMATHMLEAGADIRHIQAILGHSSLESTQVYTHLCTTHLKAVHAETHPAEKEFIDEIR